MFFIDDYALVSTILFNGLINYIIHIITCTYTFRIDLYSGYSKNKIKEIRLFIIKK